MKKGDIVIFTDLNRNKTLTFGKKYILIDDVPENSCYYGIINDNNHLEYVPTTYFKTLSENRDHILNKLLEYEENE